VSFVGRVPQGRTGGHPSQKHAEGRGNVSPFPPDDVLLSSAAESAPAGRDAEHSEADEALQELFPNAVSREWLEQRGLLPKNSKKKKCCICNNIK